MKLTEFLYPWFSSPLSSSPLSFFTHHFYNNHFITLIMIQGNLVNLNRNIWKWNSKSKTRNRKFHAQILHHLYCEMSTTKITEKKNKKKNILVFIWFITISIWCTNIHTIFSVFHNLNKQRNIHYLYIEDVRYDQSNWSHTHTHMCTQNA